MIWRIFYSLTCRTFALFYAMASPYLSAGSTIRSVQEYGVMLWTRDPFANGYVPIRLPVTKRIKPAMERADA